MVVRIQWAIIILINFVIDFIKLLAGFELLFLFDDLMFLLNEVHDRLDAIQQLLLAPKIVCVVDQW